MVSSHISIVFNFNNWCKYSARNFNFSLINIQNLKNASKLCETDNVRRGVPEKRKQLVSIFKWISTKTLVFYYKKYDFLESQVKSPRKNKQTKNRTDHMMKHYC